MKLTGFFQYMEDLQLFLIIYWVRFLQYTDKTRDYYGDTLKQEKRHCIIYSLKALLTHNEVFCQQHVATDVLTPFYAITKGCQ